MSSVTSVTAATPVTAVSSTPHRPEVLLDGVRDPDGNGLLARRYRCLLAARFEPSSHTRPWQRRRRELPAQ